MGFTPQQVDAMSMWQFMAAANGYAKSNGAEDKEKPSDEFLNWALESSDQRHGNQVEPVGQ